MVGRGSTFPLKKCGLILVEFDRFFCHLFLGEIGADEVLDFVADESTVVVFDDHIFERFL